MKKTINVVVMEDNEYYNNLLTETLRQTLNSKSDSWNYNLRLLSFTDARDCMSRIKSSALGGGDSIVFIDYYLGNGITGSHIVKILKNQPFKTTVVMLSHSREVKEKTGAGDYDYFVIKDRFAPAICSLCLRQYLDNKVQ